MQAAAQTFDLPYSSMVTARYGTFTLDMQPNITIDVTGDVQRLMRDDILTLPKRFKFAGLPAEAAHHHTKYLEINTGSRIYYIAEDKYHNDLVINLADTASQIVIIYYVYVNPQSDWRGIVSGQLTQLKSYGILSEAHLYIHVTDAHHLSREAEQLIRRIAPKATISFTAENQFEYPGIKLVYDLARQRPERNYLYFHSKGMSYGSYSRSVEDITLLTRTFANWRKNIQYLNSGGVQKIGLYPAIANDQDKAKPGEGGGWIWYNFWYATGSYLANCRPPVITDDRHYYERWLGLQQGDERPVIRNDCKSLYEVKVISKTYFSPTEAIYHQQRLIYKVNVNNIPKGLPYIIKSSFTLHLFLKFKLFFKYVLAFGWL